MHCVTCVCGRLEGETDRQTETQMDRERQTGTERDRQRQVERERVREREGVCFSARLYGVYWCVCVCV